MAAEEMVFIIYFNYDLAHYFLNIGKCQHVKLAMYSTPSCHEEGAG